MPFLLVREVHRWRCKTLTGAALCISIQDPPAEEDPPWSQLGQMQVISPLSPPAVTASSLRYCSVTGQKWETCARSVRALLALTTLQYHLQLKALRRHKHQVSRLSGSRAWTSVPKVPGMSPNRIFCFGPRLCAWGGISSLFLRAPVSAWWE